MKTTKDQIIVAVDTREQQPLDIARHGLAVQRCKLDHGDYSLLYPDLRRYLSIERKSLADFVMCATSERERFEKELLALRGYSYKFVVCEFRMADIVNHTYRSRADVESMMGTLGRWLSFGIPFIFAENPDVASYTVAKLLWIRAKDTINFAKCTIAEPESLVLTQ